MPKLSPGRKYWRERFRDDHYRSARKPKPRRLTGSASWPRSEHLEQVMVVAHLRAFHKGVLFASVPNGGQRTKRTGARLSREGLKAGYPDMLIDEARGGWFGMRIEMKREGGREVPHQRTIRRKLLARGYLSVVCVGAAAAIAEIEAYMAQPPTPSSNPLG